MAMPERTMGVPVATIRPRSPQMAWALWIVVSVIGAVIAALVGWQIRALVGNGPASVGGNDFAFVATVVSAVIAAGSQWLVLRRYRLDVYWWVPASVVAYLINVIIVEPSVVNRFIAAPGTMSTGLVVFVGALTVAAGGLVVGLAQALVLRPACGDVAWAWIPATIIGGALAGALTTGLAATFFAFPYPVALSTVTAVGALLTAAGQVPVLVRIVR